MPRPLRSTVILTLAALGTVFSAVGGWRYARASSPVNGPIVLIAVDGLRADRLGAYHGPANTPAIEQLAADGVLFEHAYTQAPLRLPAYTSLLTGRLPAEHGVRDDESVVPRRERLVAERFRDRGYATLGVVSSYDLGRAGGFDRGFDLFDDRMPLSRDDADPGTIERSGDDVIATVNEWLGTQRSDRFFLFVQVAVPDLFEAASAGRPAYDEAVARADHIVGSLVGLLKGHQLYDRATVFLTSPFGYGLGDHGERYHGVFLYDDTVRVPLIIKGAAGSLTGARISTPVQTVDITATLVDLIKAPDGGSLRGRSLKPILDGNTEGGGHPVLIESLGPARMFGWAPLAAVGDDAWWLVGGPEPELYDLAGDPGEQHNLALDRPEAVAHLTPSLEGLRRIEAQAATPAAPSRETVTLLETLGFQVDEAAEEGPDPKGELDELAAYEGAVESEAKGRFREAATRLRELVRREPRMCDAWERLGRVLSLMARFEEAADAFERAAKLRPLDARSHLRLARALVRASRPAGAAAHADLAARLAASDDRPTLAGAHALLARLAIDSDDIDGAHREATRAEQADPTLPMRRIVDGLFAWKTGEYAAAAALLETAVEALDRRTLQPRDVRFALAESLAAIDRRDDGEPYLERELALFPDDVAARTALALAYHRDGRDDDAAALALGLAQAVPTADGYSEAARLLRTLGRRREATALAQQSPGRAAH